MGKTIGRGQHFCIEMRSVIWFEKRKLIPHGHGPQQNARGVIALALTRSKRTCAVAAGDPRTILGMAGGFLLNDSV